MRRRPIRACSVYANPPVAAGGGTGSRAFDVVAGHPEHSIMAYRLESTDPSEKMPELGRALAHKEGIDLVHRYIAAMAGACVERRAVR